jgi:Na+/H+ antiporter NhaD/arsenite permease-like protein
VTLADLPLAVLAAVFLLIALRRAGGLRLRIWQVVAGGALVVLAGGFIAPAAALRAIDLEVLGLLFGMFALARALEASGLLARAAYRLFGRARHADGLLALVLAGSAAGSALLTNDTLAVVGTPVVLQVARLYGLPPIPLLLALAFGITIGSVPSPIGNPQNVLVASQLANPFVSFASALALPTLLSLAAAWVLLRPIAGGRHLPLVPLPMPLPALDAALARRARAGLVLGGLAIAAKVGAAFWLPGVTVPLAAIALAAATPVLAGRGGAAIVARIDWGTLAFFAALFVLVAAVWETPLLGRWVGALRVTAAAPAVLYPVAIGASQLVSNVPLVALYLPLIEGMGEAVHLHLAAAATLAGNLLILGAASNVIVVQRAEREGVHIGFWTFARAGIPVTAATVAIFWWWLG